MKVFISYSHVQRDWVWDKLAPSLRAGGAEVLIDRRDFVAGPGLVVQMDAVQDLADRHVLVLSQSYVKSEICRHEMERAVALDPTFARQLVVPVRKDDVEIPLAIKEPRSLYVDLRDDGDADQWGKLLEACKADLGIAAPDWLRARDETLQFLDRDQSVNLVVPGSARWRPLIADLSPRTNPGLVSVDLQNPATVPRRGFIAAMLGALGSKTAIPQPPEDLPELGRALLALGRSRIALFHFDMVLHRPDYDVNLFGALRYLMEQRQLVLLVQSRAPFLALLPRDHPLSGIDLRTVRL
jgi:hypothetical protein